MKKKKNEYSAGLRWNALNSSIKSTYINVQFKSIDFIDLALSIDLH